MKTVIVSIAAVLSLAACGGSQPATQVTTTTTTVFHCPTAAPLDCQDANVCCPEGYAFECVDAATGQHVCNASPFAAGFCTGLTHGCQ